MIRCLLRRHDWHLLKWGTINGDCRECRRCGRFEVAFLGDYYAAPRPSFERHGIREA